MSFLERAIKRGISEGVSKGVGKAVGNALGKAIEPKASDLVNKAARKIDDAAQNTSRQFDTAVRNVSRNFSSSSETSSGQTNFSFSALEGAMANLERAASGYATEISKNMKICPNCDKPTTADKKFCPSCGAVLSDETVADGAVCSHCGKQNMPGTRFCQDCGAKLPFAEAEDRAAQQKDEAVLLEWNEKLPQYPKWTCGGKNYNIECYEDEQYTFSASFDGDEYSARNAVKQYRNLLLQQGFKQAGQYPSIEHLYKMIGGICYHADTEHCFEGDQDTPTIGFLIGEPYGGFDYVKPEPKKKVGFRDLLGL